MIRVNGYEFKPEYFPDGTPRLKFSPWGRDYDIEWLYEPSEELLLCYLIKHLKSHSSKDTGFHLDMPYVPNARMDRTKEDGEIFTLKYFCEFINSLGFDKVRIRDPHSAVTMALLDNVYCQDISRYLKYVLDRHPNIDTIVYPDEGACKRYSEMFDFVDGRLNHLFGIKRRNWTTGKILGLDIHGNVPNEPFNALICDDISSYGGTFLHTARKLKELGANKVFLYVTHCEPTILAGELIGSGVLERIYTTESIFNKSHPLIEVIG